MSNLIEKVKRLRALGQSSNVHEAAAAAAAAERLIQEFNLSEADLIDSPTDYIPGRRTADTFGRRVPGWKQWLAGLLSRAYQCKIITDYQHGAIYIWGREADLDTFQYQYAWFTIEIERLVKRQATGKGKSYADAFRKGAVSAISEAIKASTASVRTTATSTALVIVDARAALAEKTALGAYKPEEMSKTHVTPAQNAAGYYAGKEAGSRLNQRTQLGASGTRMLGS